MATSALHTAGKLRKKLNFKIPTTLPPEVKSITRHPTKKETYEIEFHPSKIWRLAKSVTFADLLAEAKGENPNEFPENYYLWSFLFAEGRRISDGKLSDNANHERVFLGLLYRHIKTESGAKIAESSIEPTLKEIQIGGENLAVSGWTRIYLDVRWDELDHFRYFILQVPIPQNGMEFVSAQQLQGLMEGILQVAAPSRAGRSKRRKAVTTVRWNALRLLARSDKHFKQLEALRSEPKWKAVLTRKKDRDPKGTPRDYITGLVRRCLRELHVAEAQSATGLPAGTG